MMLKMSDYLCDAFFIRTPCTLKQRQPQSATEEVLLLHNMEGICFVNYFSRIFCTLILR